MHIREILPQDNDQVRDIIQGVIMEYGAPKEGTAYSDAATQAMYQHYQQPRRKYFVIAEGEEILGCAGVGPLDGIAGNICELQKMYFLPQTRGKGLGSQMMELCIATAHEFAYKKIYIETMKNMVEAQALYKKSGFEMLKAPLGATGHYSCPVQMIKDL